MLLSILFSFGLFVTVSRGFGRYLGLSPFGNCGVEVVKVHSLGLPTTSHNTPSAGLRPRQDGLAGILSRPPKRNGTDLMG